MRTGLLSILLYLIFSLVTISESWSLNLTLNQAIDMALRKNSELKLINVQIEKSKLDIEQQFIDIKATRLKRKRQQKALLELDNKRQDVIDSVSLNVQEKYYDSLIAIERNKIAKEDFSYAKRYRAESLTNYQDGKIDKVNYEGIVEEYKQKKEEVILSQGAYKRSVMAFLLAIDESFSVSVNFSESLRQNYKITRIIEAETSLSQSNRVIQLASLTYQVKKIEYAVVDHKMMSKHEIKLAKYEYDEAKIQLESEIRKQKVELWSRYLEISDFQAQLETAEKRLDRSKIAYNGAENRFKQGYIPKHERDNAYMQYKNQYLNLIQLIKQYNLAKTRYFFILN